MIALAETVDSRQSKAESEQGFLKMLPKTERQLNYAFRHLDPEAKQEVVQDGIVNCWLAYRRLVQQGREDEAFPSVLADFAARQIREGRICGARLNVRDPLSSYAQRKRGIRVERLDLCRRNGEWLEPLVVDRRAPVPDQVAMLIDTPAWLATLSLQRRRIATDLAFGHSTGEVARTYGLSPGRISQIRRELVESWYHFHGDVNEDRVAG